MAKRYGSATETHNSTASAVAGAVAETAPVEVASVYTYVPKPGTWLAARLCRKQGPITAAELERRGHNVKRLLSLGLLVPA